MRVQDIILQVRIRRDCELFFSVVLASRDMGISLWSGADVCNKDLTWNRASAWVLRLPFLNMMSNFISLSCSLHRINCLDGSVVYVRYLGAA